MEFNVPFQHKYGYIIDEIKQKIRLLNIIKINNFDKPVS